MALEVTGNIDLPSGIAVPSLYGRTEANLVVDGDKVICSPSFYSNKEAYDSGAPQVELDGFPAYAPYDRTVDGSDILLFSNEFIKTQLEARGYSVVIVDLN